MTSSPPSPLHHHQINAVADGNSAANTTTTPWSSETNWTVSRGSLDTAVTFESFDFPIDSESTAPKPPLLLVPPASSDFEPCEIKITFTQKHEIRQVYVRSTARVYEIYYSPALHVENEYLCTVRCSAASVEDNLFIATDVKEAVSVNLVGSNGILLKEKLAGENNIGTSEDDWVEVKLHEGNGYLSNQSSNNIRNYQDYYEATAEINDSEPCMSLTLRFLSLQNKSCVHVAEIYVFADPIDTNDTHNHTMNHENSSGSTLMTMLVPTLLGLAKSSPSSSKSFKKPEPLETEPEPTASTNSVNLVESAPVQAPSYNQVERILEQLVSRVSKIEDICLRFEENMLKPINRIEARLQCVEQQVELLSKNTKNDSKLCGESRSENTCFSCFDEKAKVNDVVESPKMEKMKKYVSVDDALAAALAGFSSFTTIDKTLEASNSSESLKEIAPECTQASESPEVEIGCDDKVVPLVYEYAKTVSKKSREIGVFECANDEETESKVVADFSSCDEKMEVNGVVESPKMAKPKKHVSIDDALAAALAGFSSCTTIDATLEASSSSESLKEMAPECTQGSEYPKAETDCDDKLVSLVYKNGKTVVVSPKSSENVVSECAFDEEAVGPTQVTSSINDQDMVDSRVDFESSENRETLLVTCVGPVYENAKTVVVSPKSSENGVFEGAFDEETSRVDFETSILEVKFESLENNNMLSPLEALLSYTGDNGIVINQQTNMRVLEEEKMMNANDLLVEFDSDCVGEGVEPDVALVHEETTFASLI